MSIKSLAAVVAISAFVLPSLLAKSTGSQGQSRLQGSTIAFPQNIGAYRLEDKWYERYAHNLNEAGASYRPDQSTDDKVVMYLLLGEVGSHDGLACALSRGEQIVGRQIKEVKTSDATASFDMGYDRKEGSIGLVASTDCWSWGCYAGPQGGFGWYAPRLMSASLFSGAEKPVPVTIKIEASLKDASLGALSDKLMREFASFTRGLNFKDFEHFERLQNQ
jgi:hypothetical protein